MEPNIDLSLLPYVVARPLHEALRTDRDDGLVGENLLATYSALLRFLALLAVSQFLTVDIPGLPVVRVAAARKAVASLRQPTLQSWFTALQTLARLYKDVPDSAPFTAELIACVIAFTRERVEGRPLHEAVTSIRNDFFGHSEGADAESKRALREAAQPLILKIVEIFRPALVQLALLRRSGSDSMIHLIGPGPDFATQPIGTDAEEEAFETSDTIVRVSNRCYPLFPLIIAAPEDYTRTEPIFSFDGYRVLDNLPSGAKGRVDCLKFRNFRHWIYRHQEYANFKDLLDRKEISPHYDARNFQPWNIADWAASETRLSLAALTGEEFFPEFYRERPQVEDRLWSWLQKSSLPALLVMAEAGMGKTSLFCHTASRLLQSAQEDVEAMESSEDCVLLLRGSDLRVSEDALFGKLCRAMGVSAFSPERPDGFRSFRDLLACWESNKKEDAYGGRRRLILLLDAANESANLQKTLEEFSALARDAHNANLAAGTIWVRLLISVRQAHFEALERKQGARTDLPLLPEQSLYAQFEYGQDGNRSLRPYMDLPPFTEAESKVLFELRAQKSPASQVPWQQLAPVTRQLLRDPLLLDLFHRTFTADTSHLTLPTTESSLWDAWFRYTLPSGTAQTTVLRDFLFRIADACLEAGSSTLPQAAANRLLLAWKQDQSTDVQGLHRGAELDLFERLEAFGYLHKTQEGEWEWRAQLLAEQVCRRALERRLDRRVDTLAEWLTFPPSSLLIGALALWMETRWTSGQVEELSLALGSQAGTRALAQAILTVAPLGAPESVRVEVVRFREGLRKLAEFRPEHRLACLWILLWQSAPVLESRQGAHSALTAVLGEALALAAQLAELEPENRQYQRDLGISYANLGDLELRLGPELARPYYADALKTAQNLAKLEPENRQYQRDLSLSYDKLGDLEMRLDPELARPYYADALKIAQNLAELEPENQDYQRDLSVSYIKLGDLELRLDPELARPYYADALKIAQNLAELEPENRDYRRDLSVLYNRLGDLEMRLDPELARPYYADALKVARQVAQLEPENRDYQRHLSVSYYRLCFAWVDHNLEQARDYFWSCIEVTCASYVKLPDSDFANKLSFLLASEELHTRLQLPPEELGRLHRLKERYTLP